MAFSSLVLEGVWCFTDRWSFILLFSTMATWRFFVGPFLQKWGWVQVCAPLLRSVVAVLVFLYLGTLVYLWAVV